MRRAVALLGLDIGGSTSRARLTIDGKVVDDRSGPGANVTEIAPRVVESRLEPLLANLPATPDACCAGSAGAEVPSGRAMLERVLGSALPESRISVVHDTRLVLAAAGFDAGIALICGTGSVAYGRDEDGREVRVGGWGWLLGDEGSGTWVVREAARELMRRRDEGEPPGAMGDALMEASGTRSLDALQGALYRKSEPGQWAALAGAVFESAEADEAAAEIVDGAAAELRGLIDEIRRRIEIDGPVVLAGGLILNQPRLEAGVRKHFPEAIRLEAEPVDGALNLAAALV